MVAVPNRLDAIRDDGDLDTLTTLAQLKALWTDRDRSTITAIMNPATTSTRDPEIERAFEVLIYTLLSGSVELCDWCGRGLHSLAYDECRRIGMGFGWDPRDPARRSDYRRLFDNLIAMHRCTCKPIMAYDDAGSPQQAKEEDMWKWFGLEPDEFDERRI